MKFISTRGKSEPVTFSEALQNGLAPDGGLYVPEAFPQIDPDTVSGAHDILAPFLYDDILENHIEEICEKALNFDIPLSVLSEEISVLEVFHGPTSAFKDVGARFLAESFSKIAELDPKVKKTILVATSGDTGGAVASAFHNKKNFDVKIYFPFDGVSERQQKQLTCWDNNIQSFAVKGDFDDCQRMVKKKLSEDKETYSSANSINIGRLLPQMTYYALASINRPGISFIVPSGNMGNVVAAFWAKMMGFPIDRINIATNANTTISKFFESGEYKKQSTVKTIANAMDVGHPSNMERLLYLFPQLEVLKSVCEVRSVNDNEIKETILKVKNTYDYIPCPHTATAFKFKEVCEGAWTLIATAHPAKFETVIEPIIGEEVPVPDELAKLLELPNNFEVIESLD